MYIGKYKKIELDQEESSKIIEVEDILKGILNEIDGKIDVILVSEDYDTLVYLRNLIDDITSHLDN